MILRFWIFLACLMSGHLFIDAAGSPKHNPKKDRSSRLIVDLRNESKVKEVMATLGDAIALQKLEEDALKKELRRAEIAERVRQARLEQDEHEKAYAAKQRVIENNSKQIKIGSDGFLSSLVDFTLPADIAAKESFKKQIADLLNSPTFLCSSSKELNKEAATANLELIQALKKSHPKNPKLGFAEKLFTNVRDSVPLKIDLASVKK